MRMPMNEKKVRVMAAKENKKCKLILRYKTRTGRLEVSGDTYKLKDRLKEIGLRWDPAQRVWYAHTKSEDDDYVDEYIAKLSEIADVEFAEDSDVKNVETAKKNAEERKRVYNEALEMTKEEKEKKVEEQKKEEDVFDKLFSCRVNLSFITVQEPSDEIARRVKVWSKVDSKYFDVYKNLGIHSFHAVFDNVKNTLYLLRDDNYEPGMDYIHDPQITVFLRELEKENLSKEEASKRLEDFIQQNYIAVDVAKELFKKLQERKEKIEKQLSIIPNDERVKQLKELFNNLSDKEAYLLPEFQAEREDDSWRIVWKVTQECERTFYKGTFLMKCNNKYVLFVQVLNINTFRLDHAIYMFRDDSNKVEEFLKSLAEKPFSSIAEEVEKYLRQNFNYKEFNYEIKPYVAITTLYDGDEDELFIEGVLVDGYTDLIKDILRAQGFRKYIGDKAWVKNARSESEARKIIEELKKKIPPEISIREGK